MIKTVDPKNSEVAPCVSSPSLPPLAAPLRHHAYDRHCSLDVRGKPLSTPSFPALCSKYHSTYTRGKYRARCVKRPSRASHVVRLLGARWRESRCGGGEKVGRNKCLIASPLSQRVCFEHRRILPESREIMRIIDVFAAWSGPPESCAHRAKVGKVFFK